MKTLNPELQLKYWLLKPTAILQGASAGKSSPKKGKPARCQMQPTGLNLYPLPQGRVNKSTSNELWQDHGDHIVAVDGPVRQFSGGWQSVTTSLCRS
jgi:hypothetical protein